MKRNRIDRRKNKNTLKAVTQAELLRFEEKIAHKKHLLSNALKIPPAINQFNTHLSETDQSDLFDILENYRPETREQRVERLKKYVENGNKHEGPKPHLLKFGIKHVVDLIEQKMAKIVIIAADVDPIEIVLYLPTLCKKLGIPYCIVKSKQVLGSLVNRDQTAVICLNGWDNSDDRKMASILQTINPQFIDCYEQTMNTWGGGVVLSRIQDTTNSEVVVENNFEE